MAAWYHNHTLMRIVTVSLIRTINNAVVSIFVYKSLSTFLIIPTERSPEVELAELLGKSLNNFRFSVTAAELTHRRVVPVPQWGVPVTAQAPHLCLSPAEGNVTDFFRSWQQKRAPCCYFRLVLITSEFLHLFTRLLAVCISFPVN